MNPAVVITAFNRPDALARLLGSVSRACYPEEGGVTLHISIDAGGDPRVLDVARDFGWPHGEKRIVEQPERLGLVRHFLACGELTREYGAVVLLEDDLFVSPAYYTFAAQALQQYAADGRVAGVSLYALWFNGYTHYPFVPTLDGTDTFFLQIPYTQGQAFARDQWQAFTTWRSTHDPHPNPSDHLHEAWLSFGGEEWFPERVKYLVDTGRFYVFPRASLTTGFGDAGTHFAAPSRFFQTPLLTETPGFRFKPLDESPAVYDSFYEILPDRLKRLAPHLPTTDIEVDLNATKSERNLRRDLVLTARRSRKPLATYGLALWPIEANVAASLPGDAICLSRKADLRFDALATWKTRLALHAYYTRGQRTSMRRELLLRVLSRIWRG